MPNLQYAQKTWNIPLLPVPALEITNNLKLQLALCFRLCKHELVFSN